MGRLKELINLFINPIPAEKSLKELAQEAGLENADLELLEKSKGGVNWEFPDEIEQTKKAKNTKTPTRNETTNQPIQGTVVKKQESDYERD